MLHLNTDGPHVRVYGTGEADLIIDSDGTSHNNVKLIPVIGHIRHAGGNQVVHRMGKILSQSENVSRDYLMDDEMTSRQ